MPQTPAYLTKDELLDTLRDIVGRVEADDSFEGTITYSLPDDGDDPGGFRVSAVYRIGNSMGQGGYRVVGELG